MDVRCEKCQTEYELDEARLKPGGVTVKCTNCGHMFKIRKRSNTNVGAAVPSPERSKPPSKPAGSYPAQPQQTAAAGPSFRRADSMLDEAPTRPVDDDGPTTERQWLIRLENGEQKSCRELATLQQWIVANVVTREALISRSGKTWKRLGDIAELAQYFDVADEARTTRKGSTSKPPLQSTMLGVGGGPMAAGGTILPDDDDMHTAPRQAINPTPPPPMAAPPAARRPTTQPPPPPPKKGSGASPIPQPPPDKKPSIPAPVGNRATAAWASDAIKPDGTGGPGGPSGPFVGKLAAIPDEPAFAGKVRAKPSSEASFDTDRVSMLRDDDDSIVPQRRGSSAGLWILLVVLIVGAGATAALYVFVFRKPDKVATAPADAAVVAQIDAAPVVTPIDAAVAPMTPAEATRHELAADDEERLQTSYDELAGKDDPESLGLRAAVGTAIAQALEDRAGLIGTKSEADKLRKQAKTIVLEAATAAQKARKAAPEDPVANLALANVLRLQHKPARDVKRYLEAAKTKAGDWARDVAIAEALLLARDSKLDDAKAAFTAIDSGDNRLEVSNDVRARFHLALIALAQSRAADAKPLVDQVLVAQPDHAGAKALAGKLETLVAKTDPLPPEDPKNGSAGGSGSGSGSGSGQKPDTNPNTNNSGGGRDDYDSWVKRADAVADSNCAKATEYYGKALELKPSGVEALTGQGYCALDAKNFATAHRKFSTALVTSPRYEPALAGIAETYTLQARKDLAIAAWKHYLEAYPNAPKAIKALERLGVSTGSPPPGGSNTGSGGDTGGGGSDTPPPPTPPAPGSGAGSSD